MQYGAVALRKMIQDIVYLNHSYILYLVYVLLNATAPRRYHHSRLAFTACLCYICAAVYLHAAMLYLCSSKYLHAAMLYLCSNQYLHAAWL